MKFIMGGNEVEFTQQETFLLFAGLVDIEIRRQAETDGIELESITVCYKIPRSAEFVCIVSSPICDKNPERAAIEGLKSALAAFIKKHVKERLADKGTDIFYKEDPEEFLGNLSEEKVGTEICFPIVKIERTLGGRFVPSSRPYTYFGIGVVGGTQEQNKSLILKIFPGLLTEMKKYDKTFSLPRALFYDFSTT